MASVIAWSARASTAVGATLSLVWRILVIVAKVIFAAVKWFIFVGVRMVPIAMILTTIMTAILLKGYPDKGRDVVLVLTGFFVSDAIYRLFVGGGNGIGMIPISGTQARAHGHVFLAVWGGILASAVVGSVVADGIYKTMVAPGQANFGQDLLVGLLFSLIVWLDTHLRYLTRPAR